MIAWLVALLFALLLVRQGNITYAYITKLDETRALLVSVERHRQELMLKEEPPHAYYLKPGIIGEHPADLRA